MHGSCCTPTRIALTTLEASRRASAERRRVTAGSTEGMVRLDGGQFLMGSDSTDVLPADGEGPVRQVFVNAFYLSRYAVTNAQFAEFTRSCGYVTEAEREGWSFVFRNHVSPDRWAAAPAGTPWWVRVDGAAWAHPEGPDSSLANREDFPVLHVSWDDAQAYCEWAGVRLATEAEWEYASRGGLEQKTFPWGDELTPGGRHRCNVWQGSFPDLDLAEDGFSAAAPVNAFEPNGFGLFNMVGNVWEWCADWFDTGWRHAATRLNPAGPESGTKRVMRGGSFLCHRSYCFRYRNSARTSNVADTTTGNLGFRVARD